MKKRVSSKKKATRVNVFWLSSKSDAEKFLGSNVALNARNRLGKTALMDAIFYLKTDVVRLLVKAGANLQLKDRHGKTVLEQIENQHWTLNQLHQIFKTLDTMRDLKKATTILHMIKKSANNALNPTQPRTCPVA